MAKMKVHELAKELDVSSKDIISLLTDKGIEVKSHMSVLEDDAVGIVKKQYAPAPIEEKKEAPKAAAPTLM